MPTRPKAVHIPVEGEYLTDGTRLVEVLAKDRHGVKVLDAKVPVEVGPDRRDPRATEVLSIEEATTKWRVVEPKGEKRVA
jgi:hypothetical protein